jgi:hypothetical protein
MLGGLAALSVGDAYGAARCAAACGRFGFPWAENMARVLKAGLARLTGDFGGAITLLKRAREVSHLQGTALYEAAMSRRLGVWMGGVEGRASVAEADLWMAGQGIVDPGRMTAMLLGWV